jgi:hypothetical protein
MICYLCASENPIDGRYCLKCGALLQGQRASPPQFHDFGGLPTPYPGPATTSGKAVASLICGLIVFLFPVSIAAIILGHLALAEIRRSGGRLAGKGMATAGLVLGYAGISIVPALIVASVVAPNVRRYRMQTNERAAIGAMRKVLYAEAEFRDSYANGYSPSLGTLAGDPDDDDSCQHARLIDEKLASGSLEGYRLTYLAVGPDVFEQSAGARGCLHPGATKFELRADPITRGKTGEASLFVDQTGVIRFNLKGPATAASPPYRLRYMSLTPAERLAF